MTKADVHYEQCIHNKKKMAGMNDHGPASVMSTFVIRWIEKSDLEFERVHEWTIVKPGDLGSG